MADDVGLRSLVASVGRGVVLLVGLAVFAVGLLAVLVPGVAGVLPVEAMVAALGSDYVVVAAVGLVAVAFAVLVLLVVAVSGVHEADLPIVESVESAPHPGQAVDRTVDGDDGDRIPDSRVERLRESAVRTLMRSAHCSRSTAERRVAEGSWTDDEVAADFLAPDDGGLFRTAVSDRDRVRRTVLAIERLHRGDADGASSTDGDDDSSGGDDTAAEARERAGGDATGTDRDRTRRRRASGPELSREGGPRRSGAGTGGR